MTLIGSREKDEMPRVQIKWMRGHDHLDYKKPRISLVLGKKGGGKSTYVEVNALRHKKIFDILGSRDNEGLCWCREKSPVDDILLVHADNVDLKASWNTCKIGDLTLDKMMGYEVVTTCDSFYGTQKSRYAAINAITDNFWGRFEWNYPIAVIIREASNYLYSRISQDGMNIKDAKADFIVFQRELRHMGFSAYMDTIRWTSIDKEIRDLADYLIIKKVGAQGLPGDLHWLYKYVAPLSLADLAPDKFLILTENAAVGKGRTEMPTFHKEEGVDLLKELGIEVTVSEELEESTDQRVGDKTHNDMVKLYYGSGAEDGMSMDNIGVKLKRGGSTVSRQIRIHDSKVGRDGICDMCSRVGSEFATMMVNKRNKRIINEELTPTLTV